MSLPHHTPRSPLSAAPQRRSLPVGPGGRLPVLQAGLGAALFVLGQFAGGVAAGSYVVLTQPDLVAPGGRVDVTAAQRLFFSDPLAATLNFGIYALVSLLGFVLLLRAFARPALSATFLEPGIGSELGRGVALGAALIGVSGLILFAGGVYRGSDPSLNGGIWAGIMLSVGAAVGEEVFFRGVLLRLLEARFGSTVAVVTLSVVFGLVHVSNGGAGIIGAVAIVLSAGLLLNVSYVLTRRLWLPMGIHFGWNAMQAAFLGTDVSGSGSGRGLFRGELPGPEWLAGGTMGLEGSVVVIVLGLAAGAWLTRRALVSGRWRRWAAARAEVATAKADRAIAKAASASGAR